MSFSLGTLIIQMISFVIFIWFTMRFVWRPLNRVMAERNLRIADGLAAADKGQQAEAEARERVDIEIARAKEQAAEILNKADKRRSEILEEAKTEAKAEAARILKGAQAEIEQEVNRARETLRSQLAAIVLSGARKIIEKEIDEKTHAAWVSKLVTQL